MTSKEFVRIRKELGKTQKEMAELLGASIKSVHSYEQGWRRIPGHVERQVFFLLANKSKAANRIRPCWEIKSCPTERKEACPAWEFHAGNFCWFINGTICECKARKTWREKIALCRRCRVLLALAGDLLDTETEEEAEGME